MRGNLNTTGVSTNTDFPLPPVDKYRFEIIEIQETKEVNGFAEELKTKNGDPMVYIYLQILDGQFKGTKIRDMIIFPKENSPAIKILGRTKHFLHCISEPYEGEIDYDTNRWKFKRVWAEIKHEEQTQGKYIGKIFPKINNYILTDDVSKPSDDPWGE